MSTKKKELHAVLCPCGFVGAPQLYPSKARQNLATHQATRACGMHPEHVRKADQEPCSTCRIEPASPKHDGNCWGCWKASRDKTYPLDLGGQWVRDKTRGVLVWKAVA